MPDYSKLDHWALKAQKEAYPARSVYKLAEMDEKFNLLKPRSCCKALDLGAAPGSWSLYILRKLSPAQSPISLGRDFAKPVQKVGFSRDKSGFLLVSVDLTPLSREHDGGLFDKDNFVFIQGDFTKSEIRQNINLKGPYNLLVSDAAPATSGNRSLDSLRSLALCETALEYASASLIQGGNLVIKVFQGGETANLLKSMRSLFENAKSFKPKACRAESFEAYYLGLGKK